MGMTEAVDFHAHTVIDEPVLARRIAAARQSMRELQLDALILFSNPASHGPGSSTVGNVRYLTNLTDPWISTLLVLPIVGTPVLLCPADLALAEAPGVEIKSCEANAYGIAARRLTEAICGKSGRAGVLGRREMPSEIASGIIAGSTRWQFVDADELLARLRLVKGPEEIERHRIAGRLSDAMHGALAETGARRGVKAWQILVEMEYAARSRGAEMARAWIAAGPAAHRPMMFPWENQQELVTGDTVFAGTYVIFEGYWGHSVRVAVKGRANANLQRIFDINLEIQDAGIAALRAGVGLRDAAKAMAKVGERYFPGREWGRAGHGLGLDYSEPLLSNSFIDPDGSAPGMTSSLLLEPGMVIELHPGFRAPELGFPVSKIGDMFLITERGAERLSKAPRAIIEI